MTARGVILLTALALSVVMGAVTRDAGAAEIGSSGQASTTAGDIRDPAGVVYRYFPGAGHRFHPLMSFAALNKAVSQRRTAAARQLAAALVARGARRGDALLWEHDFAYGGPVPWTSGFVQAVAAQALARAGELVGEPSLQDAADAAFRGLRRSLLMPLGGGSWVREYGFTSQAILNAQLQSLVSVDVYARIAGTPAARRVAADLLTAARTLLPRFDLGCWSRYELGGRAATAHYHAYHLQLLLRIASTHDEPIWRATYSRWRRCG